MSRTAWLLTLLFLVAISLPYLAAAGLAGPQQVFSGFLFNPQDGYTYLAKMRQGWEGSWLYRLPFTAKPGEGVFLFGFYLFLGHLARWSGLSLVWVFHLARVGGAAALSVALYKFFSNRVPAGWVTWAYGAALFGLGMGWLLLPTGYVPADFWVAETYAFLSAFANPHFPLSLALTVSLLDLPAAASGSQWRSALFVLPAAFALSILSPFGVILVVMILVGCWLVEVLPRVRSSGLAEAWRYPAALPLRCGLTLAAGGPFLLYYLWLTRTHPQIALWNAQNLTLTPPVWDVALALSPMLVAAGFGVLGARSTLSGGPLPARQLVVWALIGLGLIYFPFSLQRRFLMGLSVPLVGLVAVGLQAVGRAHPRRARLLAGITAALALPSGFLVVVIAMAGPFLMPNSQLYLTRDEVAALDWLQANSPPQSVVLASPDTGLVIPGLTGRRVIYGHPFETVDAAAEEEAVRSFFSGDMNLAADFLRARDVDYVFHGPRERQLGTLPTDLPLEAVFRTGDVQVYRVGR